MLCSKDILTAGLLMAPLLVGASCAGSRAGTAGPEASAEVQEVSAPVTAADLPETSPLVTGARLAALYSLTLDAVSTGMEGNRYYVMAMTTAPENRERFRARAEGMIEEGRRALEQLRPMAQAPTLPGANPEDVRPLAEVYARAWAVSEALASRPAPGEVTGTPASAPVPRPEATLAARGPAAGVAPGDEAGTAASDAEMLRHHLQMTTGADDAMEGTRMWIHARAGAAPDASEVERLASRGESLREQGASMLREVQLPDPDESNPDDPMLAYTRALHRSLVDLTDRLQDVRAPGTLGN
ncbi:hypothetical protein L6R50_11580 [Myxococcota bacterium]|nr:hypothetical protein [Myxococcota bacterium]